MNQEIPPHPLAFVSGAMPDETFHLLGVDGREAISELYRFELLLAREEPLKNEELDRLLGSPCGIALGPSIADMVHGIINEVRMLDRPTDVYVHYVATMEP
ncbi:MAG: hypothetical protein AAGA56_31410 [Myxococcota bacterium]